MPMNRSAPPSIANEAEYVEWFLRYSDNITIIRELYSSNLDRFVAVSRTGALKELQKYVTEDALFSRVWNLSINYEKNLKPLVQQCGGLENCPPELQGAAVSMILNMAVILEFLQKKYLNSQAAEPLAILEDNAPIRRSSMPLPTSQTPTQGEGESKRPAETDFGPFPVMVTDSGTIERGYQIGHFKAQLVSHPRAAGFTEYRFMLVVMGDGRKAKLLVSSERTHTMTGVLLEMAKKQMPKLQGTSGREYFLCVTDRTGLQQNYGASPDWENLEAFAQKALQLAQEHLGVESVIEVYRRRSISRLVPWLAAAAVLGGLIYWAVA